MKSRNGKQKERFKGTPIFSRSPFQNQKQDKRSNQTSEVKHRSKKKESKDQSEIRH